MVSALEWSGLASASVTGMLGALPALPPVEVQQQMRDALRSTLQRAMERVGAEGEARVVEGSPAEAIVTCAAELAASLVVVGSHGRTGLRRLALGSVAESVIRGVSCSALAVRAGEAF
ncbi:MAG: universal stress protein [Polyangiaceae bacterium]